ncbi:MAG: 8-amino-7-oxononanoate synthase [Acidobacteria bacterium]|nr:8-amino-7-oxononanoate synthase [Acidobacteriota bacterium]
MPYSIPDDSFSGGQKFVRDTLHSLAEAGLKRQLRDLEGAPGPRVRLSGREVLLLCSNNYLGLATDERLKRAAQRATEIYGCGATGSRLISGNSEPYRELEQEIAAYKGTEAALVFASGYHANLGAVTALVEAGDAIFSDALNHASLIDGARLSRAEILIYRHGDVEDLENQLRSRSSARRKLILTETVFSMDGDFAPLCDISYLAKKYGALLLVDEAHATGLFGPTGAGRVEELRLQYKVDVQMGTFSKALGSLGGHLAASKELVEYFLNRSRTFIFTTGLPPGVLAASTEAIRISRNEPARRQSLWSNVALLRNGLRELGFLLGAGESQILPLLLYDERRTMSACRFLLRQGVFVQGIRPPTVPPGMARLRITPMATHTPRDLDEALAAIGKLQDLYRNPRRQRGETAPALGGASLAPR